MGKALAQYLYDGKLYGRQSIRINKQWLICFEWREDGPYNVEIVDYH